MVCALATSVTLMISGRALQGAAMGLIPLGISAMRDLLPPERLGTSIALMSASMGIGGALGLPVAAAVAEHSSWRVLFWGATVMAIVVLALIFFLVPAAPVVATAASTRSVRSVSASACSACSSASRRARTGAGAAPRRSVCSAARWSCCWPGAGTSCAPATPGRPAGDRASGRAADQRRVAGHRLRDVRAEPDRSAAAELPAATGYGLGQDMLQMGLWMAPGGFMMMAISPLGARLRTCAARRSPWRSARPSSRSAT